MTPMEAVLSMTVALDPIVSPQMVRYQVSEGSVPGVEIHADTPRGRGMYVEERDGGT